MEEALKNILSSLGFGKNGFILSHSYFVSRLSSLLKEDLTIKTSNSTLLIVQASAFTISFNILNNRIDGLSIYSLSRQ